MELADKKTVITSFVWSFLEQGGTKLIILVVQVILARLLLPEAFGVLAILLVIVEMASTLAQSGLGTSLIQSSNTNAECYTTAFWLSVAMAIALYALIFFMAPAISAFYNMAELIWYLRVLAIVVFINAANSIQLSYLQKRLDFKSVFKANIIAVLISGVIGIATALFGFGIWALIIQVLCQSLVACVVLSIVVPWKPSFCFNIAIAKELFAYGWKICVTGILSVLYSGVSELVIGKMCTVSDLGYYSQGRKWPNAAISLTSNALQNVMFPVFSTIKSDRTALVKAVQKSLVIGTFVVAPLSLLFATIAEPFVSLLLTDKWLPCVPIFQVTCIANCLLILQLVNLRAYMALGDSALYLKLQIIKVLIGSTIICSTAIFTRDIYWVAIATSAFSLFSVIIVDLQPAQRTLGVGRGRQLKLLAPIFALSFFAAAVSLVFSAIELPSLFKIVVQSTAFAATYLLGSKLFKVAGFYECRDALKTLLKKSTARPW